MVRPQKVKLCVDTVTNLNVKCIRNRPPDNDPCKYPRQKLALRSIKEIKAYFESWDQKDTDVNLVVDPYDFEGELGEESFRYFFEFQAKKEKKRDCNENLNADSDVQFDIVTWDVVINELQKITPINESQ